MNQSAESVAQLFLDRVAKSPDREAYRFPTADGTWKSLSWKQTGDRVRAIACGLRAIGLEHEQRVTILAGTRVEWILADLGVMCAAGATTTIYPSNTADECVFILKDSNTVIVFAEDEKQVKKLRGKRSELPEVAHVITFDDVAVADGDDGWVISLAELEAKGTAWEKEHPGELEKIARSVKRDQLATLIYTSGTTGQPKGVELVHDCWVFEAEGIASMKLLVADDLQFFWLPLSHVFGKVLEAAQLSIGFSTAIDGRVDKIVENLGTVKPTFVAAVPRIFEKVYNKIVGDAKRAGGLKWKIFQWAVDVGKRASREKQAGHEPKGLLALQYAIADKLVYSKLKERFGGRLRYFVSGSAPLNRDISEFFHGFGLLILEGYGLTEASASNFVNRPDKYKFGTVGQAVPGTEIKIAESDGEILLRCRGVMRGYHGLPDATKEAIDADGWFRTGDIGELDSDGFLKITDRKKDLIKTSGGKYIAPQLLEGKLKTLSTLISQAVIHGDKRNYVSALVTLDEPELVRWGAEHGLSVDYKALTQHEKVRAEIQTAIDALNKSLPSYSTVKKFAILTADFTIESGELTASQKVRRKLVEKNNQKILDDFYKDALQ
ncbi:MAG: long-chain fatty acid--CoA ligase [Polyangia bacterium]